MRTFKSLLGASLLALSASAAAVRRDSAPAAAAYFINNEPSGNEVVVLAIDWSGNVSFSKSVSTLGVGLHANLTGPDSTISQNSVLVSGNYLFAVNPGSDTVSLFSIDETDPTNIQLIGFPAASAGNFPIAIAAHPKLPVACVLYGGATNGVSCNVVDPVFGLLPIESSWRGFEVAETTPPSGPPGSFADVIFSEDGKHLYVSLKGMPPAVNGTLYAFEVDEHGVLAQNFTTNTGGPVPFSINNIPGRQAIFLTEASGGVETFDFTWSFSDVTANVTPINGSVATCWSSYSPATGNFYIDDASTGLVSEISLGQWFNPTVVKQYQVGATSAPLDNAIATIGGQEYLLVIQAASTSVSVLKINGPGDADIVQQLDLTGAPVKLSINMIGMAAWSPF